MHQVQLRLLCRGLVQGVGFRPAVHRLAAALGLSGTIANVPGGVELWLAGPRERLEHLLERLPTALPEGARLEPLRPEWLDEPAVGRAAAGLTIAAAPPMALGVGLVAPALAPDRAPCALCRAELADPASRRHLYPFISCSVCGPRYSIATAEPFARAHTTLASFGLCCACQTEFDDATDRRFHAETISCPACGPRLELLEAGPPNQPQPGGDPKAGQGAMEAAALIERAAALIKAGAIVALQGVGGFQLLVDATNATAVERLRRRKRRPAKPFALLVDDLVALEPFCTWNRAELELLASPAAPIVLLQRRPEAPHGLAGVAPGSPALGVMRPASPLHQLLTAASGRPLVATSGNRSGEPLCHERTEALERLAGIADAWLLHNRPIARPLDDSLLQVIDGRAALLRRARGYTPTALTLPGGDKAGVLALGSDLKTAPALRLEDRVWLAPHLGDLAQPRVEERLRQGVAELLRHYGEQLTALACDSHPGYISHQLASPLRASLPPQPVDHHLAHGLAVVAEHALVLPVLAFGFDGLGYGPEPEHLRGSELLWIAPAGPPVEEGPSRGLTVTRMAALRPFPLPGAERAMAEPRRVALGLLHSAGALGHPGAARTRAAFPAADRQLLEQAMAGGCASPDCSAMGRLFDGVASLLGLCQLLNHEGEAGLRLEAAAAEAEPAGAGNREAYPLPLVAAPGLALGRLDWQPLLEALLDDVAAGTPVSRCAARFHAGLVAATAATASLAAATRHCRQVVLAGGCFQNRRLLEGTITALRRRGLRPYWGEQVPVNDGGLALGQVLAATWGQADAGMCHGSAVTG